MDDKLKAAIDELQDAISRAEADGVIADDERAELRDLVARLDDALAEPERHDGLGDQLEEAAVRFDSNYPTLSAVIRSAVDTLSGYGI